MLLTKITAVHLLIQINDVGMEILQVQIVIMKMAEDIQDVIEQCAMVGLQIIFVQISDTVIVFGDCQL